MPGEKTQQIMQQLLQHWLHSVMVEINYNRLQTAHGCNNYPPSQEMDCYNEPYLCTFSNFFQWVVTYLLAVDPFIHEGSRKSCLNLKRILYCFGNIENSEMCLKMNVTKMFFSRDLLKYGYQTFTDGQCRFSLMSGCVQSPK